MQQMRDNSAASNHDHGLSPYVVICDAGSTGTRLYVYNHKAAPAVGNIGLRADPSSSKVTTTTPVDNVKQPESSLDINIQVGKKLKPGLSEQMPSSAADYILPSILDAVDMIPSKYHSNTPLMVYATGGMRMLKEQQQEEIYDELATGLMSNTNVPFRIKRENFLTIDGSDEGYFAVLAVNYLAGRVGSDLRVLSQKSSAQTNRMVGNSMAKSRDMGLSVLGALDLGGASAQIVFYIPENESGLFDSNRHVRSKTSESGQPLLRYVHREDFYSKSILGFGTEPVRARLEAYVVKRAQHEENIHEEGDVISVSNPCYFRGYKTTRNNITHIGIGDGEKCMQHLNDIISKQITDAGNHNDDPLGARHPQVQGDFYAMSLYYYTLDFVRAVMEELIRSNETLSSDKEKYIQMQELLVVSNPSLESLRAAADVVCSWQHAFLLEHKHAYIELTSPEKLPHRCLEFSYIVILLQKLGFFHKDNQVHFVHVIRNQTAEWTLGAFLDRTNNNQKGASNTSGLQEYGQESRSVIEMPMHSLLLLVTGILFYVLRKKGRSYACYTKSSATGSLRLQKSV